MVFKYTCQLDAWDGFWVQRQYSTWEAASTRCFANPADGPSGLCRKWSLPAPLWFTKTLSGITGNPITISPQLRMHFCSFGPGMNVHWTCFWSFCQPQLDAYTEHMHAKTSFKGFQCLVAMCPPRKQSPGTRQASLGRSFPWACVWNVGSSWKLQMLTKRKPQRV